MSPEELKAKKLAYNEALTEYDKAIDKVEEAANNGASYETLEQLRDKADSIHDKVRRLDSEIRIEEVGNVDAARGRARAQFRMAPSSQGGGSYIQVNEPDMYERNGRSFFADLYAAQVRDDVGARQRIEKHHQFEVEKRAVTSSTLGGIIPPAYLVDMYAKASRNGRVFADQVNQQVLPDVGMSLIVPRLTQGTAAGIQATENTTVSTQDPTETDLTVNVRTIAGFSPVSRQSIERAAYSDQILFEDLTARYWAQLDTQCLNGSGGSGQILGLLQTSGLSTSAASTITVAGVYPKIADVIQQINTAAGGLGFTADKIFMHPRRWGFFNAALDSQNRPVIVPEAGQGVAMNSVAVGQPSGYGGPVGRLLGLPVYLDANIPTNLGTNTNEDRIVVISSPVVHLWERDNDPVTVAFEQTAATALQVTLICFGYAAFSGGRYPSASGYISGLTPPSF